MEYRNKGHFRILHAKTGELLATFFCENDHRSVDVLTLAKALPQYECKNISIVRITWDDYDEVTVFVMAKKKPEGQKEKVKEKRARKRRKRRKRRISRG